MAKATTDAILAHFKDGSWKCAKKLGTYFYRTNVFADFPAPDASFIDEKNVVHWKRIIEVCTLPEL